MIAFHRLAMAGAILLNVAGSMAIVEEQPARPLPTQAPAPELSPEDVARFQMSALTADAPVAERIAGCYRFASPANRDHTGPIDSFAKLFDVPEYRMMLAARRYLVGKAIVEKDQAYLLVTMVDDGDRLAMFRFFLTKESKPPYAGCWMTDSVIPLRIPEQEESQQPEHTPAI